MLHPRGGPDEVQNELAAAAHSPPSWSCHAVNIGATWGCWPIHFGSVV